MTARSFGGAFFVGEMGGVCCFQIPVKADYTEIYTKIVISL